jgi:hypothetical protein
MYNSESDYNHNESSINSSVNINHGPIQDNPNNIKKSRRRRSSLSLTDKLDGGYWSLASSRSSTNSYSSHIKDIYDEITFTKTIDVEPEIYEHSEQLQINQISESGLLIEIPVVQVIFDFNSKKMQSCFIIYPESIYELILINRIFPKISVI